MPAVPLFRVKCCISCGCPAAPAAQEWPHTMRSGRNPKVLAKCILKYYTISWCHSLPLSGPSFPRAMAAALKMRATACLHLSVLITISSLKASLLVSAAACLGHSMLPSFFATCADGSLDVASTCATFPATKVSALNQRSLPWINGCCSMRADLRQYAIA